MSCRNLVELHHCQADQFGPRTAVRSKHCGIFTDMSWDRYRSEALACAAGLVDAGILPGDRVGLLAENRLEWLLADMGILTAAAVNVPPHAPLSARQIYYQLDNAEVRWLFVSNREQLEKVLQVRSELPLLEGIVVFDEQAASNSGLPPCVCSWLSFLYRGRRALPRLAGEIARREQALGTEDLATIMYTSGTTGNPKGVMLTHGNLLSNTSASQQVAPYTDNSVVLNWLPLSHIYARTVDHYQSLAGGIQLCLAESAETVVDDLEEIKPTHFAAVPRFYEKLLTAVAADDTAKVEKRLRDIFGPRISWLSAGGAPLPVSVAEVYVRAGLPLYQGYGLTESSPVISFNRRGANKIGTVGQAIPGVEIALGPDGEVLSRGPHIMKGYWKDPKATAEAIEDGWLHTGDLGTIDADGFLRITGRKKELLVLSNGKKVVPSYLEGLLLGEECVDQVVICGEGRNYLTALIVPHWDNLRRQLDIPPAEQPEQILIRPAVYQYYRTRIDRALKDVANWEQVRKFILLPTAFSVAAEELTVSLKIRRNVIQAHYAAQIEALYRD